MSPRRPRARTLLVAAALASVLFALTAFVMVHRAESAAQDQYDAEDSATGAAAEALPTMLGYRHQSVKQDLEDATKVMTKSFAKKYAELSPQLATVAQQRQIDVTAVVRDVAALECGQECSTQTVRVLAFVDQNRTIAGKAASPAALSVVVTMKQVDGDWKVADLQTT